MKKLAPFLVLALIIPQFALAAWWNPFTWNIFSFFFPHPVEQAPAPVAAEQATTSEAATENTPTTASSDTPAPPAPATEPEKPKGLFGLPALPKISLPSILPPAKPTAPTPPPAATTTEPATDTSASAPPVSKDVNPNIAAALKASVVNIYCVSHNDAIPSTTGSGVIVNSRGVILTAAHVAQMFLLEDYLGSDQVSCTIRTGSPAHATYLAEPAYVSNSWLLAHPQDIEGYAGDVTGEHDVGVLVITGSATGGTVPTSFPALPFADGTPDGNTVTIGGYGAEKLSASQIRTSLYLTIANGDVIKYITYGGASADGFYMYDNKANQHGSSGGAIVDKYGKMVGIVVTTMPPGYEDTAQPGNTIAATISDTAHLGALSTNYVTREFGLDTGNSFEIYFSGASPSGLAKIYRATALSQGEDLAKANGITK